ncbi:MAG: hypothetical protein RH862_07010 [Leptospiraceae bacterium]
MKLSGDWVIATSLGLGLFIIYLSAPVYYGSDAEYAVPQIVSILQHGDQNLDEYAHLYKKQYQILKINGHYYDAFPFGTVYLGLVPALFLQLIYDPNYISLHREEFALIIAGILMALASSIFYRLGRLNHLSLPKSLLLALIAGLGTSILSTGSRALWQQSGIMLMYTLILYCYEYYRKTERPIWIGFISLLLGFSFAVRPLSAILIVCLGIQLFLTHWKKPRTLLMLVLPGLIVIGALVVQSYTLFGNWLHPYYLMDRPGHDNITGALAANLFSPARGLFFWHPILLYSFVWMIRSPAHGTHSSIYGTLLIVCFLHLLAVSAFKHWWGGHSMGPRLTSDLVPLLLYSLIPAIREINHWKRPAFTLSFILLAFLGIAMHLRAVFVPEVGKWNLGPPDVDRAPNRIWKDSPPILSGDRTFRTLLKMPVPPKPE